jgi:hypothetical protein
LCSFSQCYGFIRGFPIWCYACFCLYLCTYIYFVSVCFHGYVKWLLIFEIFWFSFHHHLSRYKLENKGETADSMIPRFRWFHWFYALFSDSIDSTWFWWFHEIPWIPYDSMRFWWFCVIPWNSVDSIWFHGKVHHLKQC